jgi:hypothetical protein
MLSSHADYSLHKVILSGKSAREPCYFSRKRAREAIPEEKYGSQSSVDLAQGDGYLPHMTVS